MPDVLNRSTLHARLPGAEFTLLGEVLVGSPPDDEPSSNPAEEQYLEYILKAAPNLEFLMDMFEQPRPVEFRFDAANGESAHFYGFLTGIETSEYDECHLEITRTVDHWLPGQLRADGGREVWGDGRGELTMQYDEREELVREGLLSIPEAEAFSGVKKSKLYLMMETGELPYVKLGRRRLIPKRALIQLLARELRVTRR